SWQEKNTIIILTMLALTVITLIPNVIFIKHYLAGPVLGSDRVAVINELNKFAKTDDYVISWWDYGGALWFYGNVKTIASPNYQDPAALYILSKLLIAPTPLETANLMRWSVEKFASGQRYFTGFSWEGRHPDEFLATDKTTAFNLPPKTKDAYLFLPIDILSIAYPIASYSNIDLHTGNPLRNINFVSDGNYQQAGTIVKLAQYAITLDFDKLTAVSGNQTLPIKAFHIAYYDQTGNLKTKSTATNITADLHAVVMPHQHVALIMDDQMFNSSLIQMLVFENYDHALFEPVALTPGAKIYRLKKQPHANF
ncbi:MAG: hypothetical protein V1763_00290, partial [Parcubacteria group bacterium]